MQQLLLLFFLPFFCFCFCFVFFFFLLFFIDYDDDADDAAADDGDDDDDDDADDAGCWFLVECGSLSFVLCLCVVAALGQLHSFPVCLIVLFVA